MTELHIFDIDGTLLTSKLDGNDDVYFLQTLDELYGIKVQNTDWETYNHSTDYGLLEEIFLQNLGRNITENERLKVIKRYYELQQSNEFCEVLGSVDYLQSVIKLGHDVGIATGNFDEVAKLKLQKIGLNIVNIPVVGCDNYKHRHDIIKAVQTQYKPKDYAKVIYYGDKIWDYNATKTLGIDFIGIGKNENMRKLANKYYDDFSCINL